MLTDKRVVITGGTGSLGKTLLRRILSGEFGQPRKLVVFSRDEAKQHDIRTQYLHNAFATDEVAYSNFTRLLEFQIGDVRDYASVAAVLRGTDIVFHAAALKQVPACEYFPFEAIQTNLHGAQNIVRAIREHDLPIETVVGVSTDKAVNPVNVMGMTKALQERLIIRANLDRPQTRFIVVRYGNVLASRGSVIPLFHHQIRNGGPVTLTDPRMTRFLLSLDEAVDTIFAAVKGAKAGEIYVPRVMAANMKDLATALIGDRGLEIKVTGIRPGEKLHEVLVSQEESFRTSLRGEFYAVAPLLPELGDPPAVPGLTDEYSSGSPVMSLEAVVAMLEKRRLRVEDTAGESGELLR
jgi:FlaA1/EpsC-like NDP-sugar epimerase